jgi:hypothetical protein
MPNMFEPAEEQVRPLLEDAFKRYKKTLKGYGNAPLPLEFAPSSLR